MRSTRLRRLLLILPAATLLGIDGSTARAQITFAPQVPYSTAPAGLRPNGIAAGDLDGDGDLDLVTADVNSDTASVLLNDGSGAFVSGGAFAADTFPVDVAVADLDGDGDLDLAIANYDHTNPRVSVLLNNGSASFAFAGTTLLAVRPSGIVAADFTGDGLIDLAVSLFDFGGSAAVLRNIGGASFLLHAIQPTGQHSFGLAAGDVDGANGPDLVVANDQAKSVSVLLNAGGGFLTGAVNVPSALAPAAVALADLDDDGDLDIAAANRGGNRVFVHWNDGAGGFPVSGTFPAGFGQLSVEAADLDCDGRNDLAVVANQPDKLGLRRGLAGQIFGPLQQFVLPDDPRDIVAGDFSGDGRADLATANTNSSTVSVLLNTTPVTFGTVVFRAGIRGDFLANPPPATVEYTSPSPALAAFLAGSSNPPLQFDEFSQDQRFGHTFAGLPGGIVGATLTVRLRRGAGGFQNDSVHLGFDGASSFSWSAQFQNLPGNTWLPNGAPQLFVLNLANLLPGGVSLLAKLNADRALDVFVQDDTRIDFMVLRLQVCKSTPLQLTQDALLRGQTVTLTVSGAPPGQPVFVGGSYSGIDPGSFLALFATRVCLNAPTFLVASAVADATGTATLTWTVPAGGPAQQYLSTQAVVSTGSGLVLSNTITAPIY